MKRQEFVTGSTVRGPSQRASRKPELQSQGLQDENNDAPTAEVALSRDERDAIEARSTRRAVTLWLMQTLLMTLCSRRPCRNCSADRESTLPRGCILAVRYSSQ